jgi:ethanolamine-phosphate cytidylyltransferase
MADELPEHPPKVAIPMADDRIWIDGCFDFTHHGLPPFRLSNRSLTTPGHAGAMLQAKRLGTYLCVGIHSDAEILANKGPTVMTLDERVLAVSACRWANLPVPGAPYVTEPAWMDAYGCRYVVHGDDVTTDASGEDCYRIVKQAGRFRIVKRTPGISTTDLVGRMLLCTKTHHIKDLGDILLGDTAEGKEMLEMMRNYASDAQGVVGNGPPVFEYRAAADNCREIVSGVMPSQQRRIVYVDGGFDLFTPGHIEFLKMVIQETTRNGEPEPYVVAGIHSDTVICHWKGLNYPIMSLFERSMCVLQCRYIHSLVLDAPFIPDKAFLDALEKTYGAKVEAVFHGPTAFMEGEEDTYKEARERGIYREVGEHRWMDVNAGTIVNRIMKERALYEERQRKKGVKADKEVDMVN